MKKRYIVIIIAFMVILTGCANKGESVPCITPDQPHTFGVWEKGGKDKWGYMYQYNHCRKCNYRIISY